MKNIIFLSVLSLFVFSSCGGNDDNSPQDLDGDGYSINNDCDDNNAAVSPGATEIPYNGIDDDCDPLTPDDDIDGDTYNNDDDCDDSNATINPGATEVCGDGIDNNCDDNVDEGCAIGDLIEGGVVFYIAPTPIDLDGDGILDRGLVCAIQDLSTRIQWYNGMYSITGATATALGTGSANTTAIITNQGTATDYAARLARAYTGGGFDDWFLPSKDELNEMYINKAAINTTAVANGGAIFSTSYYWSSTEFDSVFAWLQDFSIGFQDDTNKFNSTFVRAVRAF